ncbi:uncharacterized protein [Amphiura filiformis]|uniref:uncharacterized protein n=1 Tax=Amphiura filiformis TaxID=82378 RepID=UPI003B20CEF7
MTIAAAGSQDGALQPTGVDDALPESMEPIWRKLNKPMQPMTIGSQGKISKSQHQSRHMFDPGHDEDDHLEEVTGDPLDKEDENIHEAELENSYEDEETNLTQYSAIENGDMVAVYVDHFWKSSPLIGQVVDVNMEEGIIVIQWFYASWSGKCGPLFLGGGAHKQPKTECLDIRSVLLWGFKLTPAKYLKSATVVKLKRAYKEIGLKW